MPERDRPTGIDTPIRLKGRSSEETSIRKEQAKGKVTLQKDNFGWTAVIDDGSSTTGLGISREDFVELGGTEA